MGTRHIVYMDLGGLEPAVRNPKEHDLPSLVNSLRRYGWTEPAILDERTGRLVAGHGRREACIMLRQQGDPPPGGVFVDDDGEWLVPVSRGWASRDDTEAEAYIITSNSLTAAGGWHDRTFAAMLEDIVTADAPLIETTGLTFDDVDDLIRKIDPETLGERDPDKPERTGAPDPDPHMPLPDGDESVIPETPTVDVHGTRRTHTCPDCGTTFED